MVSRRIRASLALVALFSAIGAGTSGCVALLGVGAGATVVGATAQERGLSGAWDDTKIRSRINELWLDHNFEMFQNVGLTVSQGRVLLTGKVKSPEMRLDAVRLAWKADNVREVINEIQVTEEGGIATYAQDVWMSTKLRSKLLFDDHISSLNYSVETVNGTIYLMGIAQDEGELKRVTNHARNIEKVKRVVNHVRIKPASSVPDTEGSGNTPPAAAGGSTNGR